MTVRVQLQQSTFIVSLITQLREEKIDGCGKK